MVGNHHFHLKNCLAFRCQIASSKWAANTNPLSSYDLDESGETTVILKPEFRAQRNTFHLKKNDLVQLCILFKQNYLRSIPILLHEGNGEALWYMGKKDAKQNTSKAVVHDSLIHTLRHDMLISTREARHEHNPIICSS